MAQEKSNYVWADRLMDNPDNFRDNTYTLPIVLIDMGLLHPPVACYGGVVTIITNF